MQRHQVMHKKSSSDASTMVLERKHYSSAHDTVRRRQALMTSELHDITRNIQEKHTNLLSMESTSRISTQLNYRLSKCRSFWRVKALCLYTSLVDDRPGNGGVWGTEMCRPAIYISCTLPLRT